MSRSILLVDDDQAILDMLAGFFTGQQWSVTRAATGERALDQFDTERPDLVLLDLDLPDTSGLPVLSRLRERDPEVAVLMLTGHGDIETAVEAMRRGAENFLTKPVELDQLGAAVERALEKVELRRRNRFLTGQREAGNGLEALGSSARMRALANIRELRNLLERVLILAEDADAIRAHHLPPELRNGSSVPTDDGTPMSLEDVERRHIARTLERTGGNRSRTARLLGISRATLYDKLDRYELKEVGL